MNNQTNNKGKSLSLTVSGGCGTLLLLYVLLYLLVNATRLAFGGQFWPAVRFKQHDQSVFFSLTFRLSCAPCSIVAQSTRLSCTIGAVHWGVLGLSLLVVYAYTRKVSNQSLLFQQSPKKFASSPPKKTPRRGQASKRAPMRCLSPRGQNPIVLVPSFLRRPTRPPVKV